MSKFGGDRTGLTPEVAEAVARELVVPVREVIEMSSRLTGDVSLNAPVSDDGPTEWEAMLVDHSPNAEAIVAEQDESAHKTKALRSALGVLTARERRVFVARRLSEDPPSLEQLGRELSISGERVRQIETLAFEKVKRAATRNLRPCRHSRPESGRLGRGGERRRSRRPPACPSSGKSMRDCGSPVPLGELPFLSEMADGTGRNLETAWGYPNDGWARPAPRLRMRGMGNRSCQTRTALHREARPVGGGPLKFLRN